MFLCHLDDQDDNDENDNLLEIGETSNIFRHYDVENSGSESGCSSFSQGICYNVDSASTTDSILEEDRSYSVISEDDNHIQEFEEKIKIAFEKSKKIDVPTKHDTINHSKWKEPINAKNLEEFRSAGKSKSNHMSREPDIARRETKIMNHIGCGDSLNIGVNEEERSVLNYQDNGSGDTHHQTNLNDKSDASQSLLDRGDIQL